MTTEGGNDKGRENGNGENDNGGDNEITDNHGGLSLRCPLDSRFPITTCRGQIARD